MAVRSINRLLVARPAMADADGTTAGAPAVATDVVAVDGPTEDALPDDVDAEPIEIGLRVILRRPANLHHEWTWG